MNQGRQGTEAHLETRECRETPDFRERLENADIRDLLDHPGTREHKVHPDPRGLRVCGGTPDHRVKTASLVSMDPRDHWDQGERKVTLVILERLEAREFLDLRDQ